MKKSTFLIAALAVASAVPLFACTMGGPGLCGVGGYPPPMASHGGKVAQLLLALAAGYAVLALAAKQARKLSITGLVIGWFIIAVSVSGLLCIAAKRLCSRCHGAPAAACPFMADKSACPGESAKGDNDKDDDDKDNVPTKTPATESKAAPAKKK